MPQLCLGPGIVPEEKTSLRIMHYPVIENQLTGQRGEREKDRSVARPAR